jgi:hypothetical protein
VRSIDYPEQQKAVAESVVDALPAPAVHDLAATVVRSLDSPEQQKAADCVVGALPDATKPDLEATVLRSLDSREQQKAAVLSALGHSRRLRNNQVAAGITRIGTPDATRRQRPWYMSTGRSTRCTDGHADGLCRRGWTVRALCRAGSCSTTRSGRYPYRRSRSRSTAGGARAARRDTLRLAGSGPAEADGCCRTARASRSEPHSTAPEMPGAPDRRPMCLSLRSRRSPRHHHPG